MPSDRELRGCGADGWALQEGIGLQARLAGLQSYFPDLAKAQFHVSSAPTFPSCSLVLQDGKICLRLAEEPSWAGICVDLLDGEMAHRNRQPIAGEMVVKAVWGRWKGQLSVLDATAGLGRDGFLLARSGAQVVSCERHPAIALLLADGIWRLKQALLEESQPTFEQALARWQFRHTSAFDLLDAEMDFDVVYLDPMFPHRQKTALVKKEMRAFRALVGEDDDAQALFDLACKRARKRVVVKRPSAGPVIVRRPDYTVEGKSSRFDVYL
ncbi:Protein of unknown function (DUF548) [gamma proteobacterium HdN1]|nr:Protein of unknown function (DUF548) [gamma proteobacterium HdN1]